MPNLPISQLPSLTNPQLSSVIPISEGSTTYRTTLGAIVSYISASVADTGSFVTTSSFNSFTASYNAATSSFLSYYGSFYHTASMILASPNVASTMSFSSTDISYGVTVSGSSNDKIKFTNAGVYNIQFSAQLDKTNSSNATVYIWIAKNNSDIPLTNTGVTLGGGTNDASVAAWNFFVDANAGDFIQLKWGASNTNARLLYSPTASVGPAVPSIILTANRVS
jgi:hypothetical protein